MSNPDWIVTLPPPTPNGGLHVGHLSGPFLAADVFAKYTRLTGGRCVVNTFSDVNQSYVRVTAERQQRDPRELAHHWTLDIQATLQQFGCDVDDFLEPDSQSCAFVRSFFLRLNEKGILGKRNFPSFFSEERGCFLDEAGVSGFCPRCLDSCKCGICESCGFINNPRTLLEPRDTITASQALIVREVPVMVFEMEPFRSRLAAFYRNRACCRTRYKWLAEEALSQPLPAFPITLQGDWGIPVNHSEFPGQVINAWPELVVHQLYGHKRSIAAKRGESPRVVNFFGFDNSYFYATLHAALLIAAGEDAWLPYATITNEFYNLEHSKFSTSNQHVIWASDLAGRVAPDLIRYFGALNAPGWEKSNFNEDDMARVLTKRIVEPWSEIETCYSAAPDQASPPAHDDAPLQPARIALRGICRSYGLDRFNLRQAAEDISHLLAYIRYRATSGSASKAELAYYLKCFAQAAFPVMPHGAATLYHALTGQKLKQFDVRPEPIARAVPAGLFYR